MSVENHLAELRQARGLSAGELAAKAGITRQTIYAIEIGRYDPSLPLAFKIAAVFDDRIENLFFPSEDGDTQA